jgi:hypothetical protein
MTITDRNVGYAGLKLGEAKSQICFLVFGEVNHAFVR